MYKLQKQHVLPLLEIIASIEISFYGMYLSSLALLIGIASLVTMIPYLSNSVLSQLLFIAGFFLSCLAFISLNLINKKKWQLLNAKIVDYKIKKLQILNIKIWRVRFWYSFNFNGNDYVKKVYGKTFFYSEREAKNYSIKHSIKTETVLPVNVFKPYPKLSSINTKVNIFFLIYFYLILLASSLLLIFGFLYHIAGTVDMRSLANSQNQQYVNTQLNKIVESYITNLNVWKLILPVLVLVVMVLFIIKSLVMLIQNKMFFFQPKVDTELFLEKIVQQNLTVRHCVYCNQKNDLDSEFCLHCGRKLAN